MTFILTMVIFIITVNENHALYEQLPLSIYDLKPHPLTVKKKSKSEVLINGDNVTQNHNP